MCTTVMCSTFADPLAAKYGELPPSKSYGLGEPHSCVAPLRRRWRLYRERDSWATRFGCAQRKRGSYLGGDSAAVLYTTLKASETEYRETGGEAHQVLPLTSW
jgi:hypothetical protein